MSNIPSADIPAGTGGSGLSRANTDIRQIEILVRGRPTVVPSLRLEGRSVISRGKWLKVASVRDEDLWEGQTVPDAKAFVSRLKEQRLGADIFTFSQRIPDTERQYDFYMEEEIAAALPITTYERWWKECTEYSVRKAVNKGKKSGVAARVVNFDDEFVRGVCEIYAESPARQGRAFWHYNKGFQAVKRELETYLNRSVYLGAYFEDKLIGSTKITYVGPTATIMQIFCSQNHFDKRPNNALIAKAVEVCEREHKTHLIYGNFVYNDLDTTLTEFKRRHGFQPIPLPRYYVPLTLRGAIALKCGLHRGLVGFVPPAFLKRYRTIRAAWYARTAKAAR
jgi:hypothetical protein